MPVHAVFEQVLFVIRARPHHDRITRLRSSLCRAEGQRLTGIFPVKIARRVGADSDEAVVASYLFTTVLTNLDFCNSKLSSVKAAAFTITSSCFPPLLLLLPSLNSSAPIG